MTTTTDDAALLAAIIAHPNEDTPRLMYADWLDENAGSVECFCKTGWDQSGCKVCGNTPDENGYLEHGRGCYVIDEDGGGCEMVMPCANCNGDLFVSDGRTERAEFIRLQVALARESDDTAREAMKNRAGKIWYDGLRERFSDIKGVVFIPSNYEPAIGIPNSVVNTYAFVTRGFVSDLYFARMSDVCERARVECKACDGKGYAFTKEHSVFYRQGHNICADCQTCRGKKTLAEGDWQFTEAALDLAREHPIQRVWVGDAGLQMRVEMIPGRGQYSRHLSRRWSLEVEFLPQPIATLLGDNAFGDESEALDAVATATAKAMRKTAGVSE